MSLTVSVGQAACNALATWLRSALTTDVSVFERWPEANEDLFSTGGTPARAVVTIHRVGARQRLNVVSLPTIDAVSAIVGGSFNVTFRLGAFIQPVQLDVWAKTDDDRDDVINQLDQQLNASPNQTITGVTGEDPVRDGVLVAMNPSDGYSGNIDFFLDEPAIADSPDSVMRSEYRATYFGEARGPFVRVVSVPPMHAIKLKEKLYVGATVPASILYDATTLTANPTPPPAYTISHDQEP